MNTVETEPLRMAVRIRVDAPVEPRELEAARKVEASIAYMMRHLDRPLQASTLAARVNVSPSHFYTIFKRYVGSTPIDYFIRLRMRRARRLLEDPGMSVKAVAYTLGYDDPFYFSRIFKSFNRIAPSQYRLQKLRTREAPRDYRPARSFSAACLPQAKLRCDN